MKQSFLIILTIVFCSTASGQNKHPSFLSTKGTWHFPISDIQSVDTMTRDCLGIRTNSPFLVLKSSVPQPVKAVQSGIVRAVFNAEGVYTVMVQTEEYYTVYTGLSAPLVEKDDSLKNDCTLGTLAKGEDEEAYELTLMLLKGEKPQNINSWSTGKLHTTADFRNQDNRTEAKLHNFIRQQNTIGVTGT